LLEDKFTPEAIAEVIEQMKKREDVRIGEIKNEADAVTIMEQCQIAAGKGWDYNTFTGILARLPKA
jgi:hypothetical protein